ncbi:MAG: GNAT family N-acetyltransferase [Candidatus Nitrosocosmicus sp.]
MVSNIIKVLKENEFSFCSNWHSGVVNIDNRFLTLVNKDLHDDYFINRTVINKKLHFNLNDIGDIEKLMHPLLQLSKEEKMTFNLHIGSDQSLLEDYLICKNFNKIDEVWGLHYPNYSDMSVSNAPDSALKQIDQFLKVLVVDNADLLKKWIEVYCLSFDIDKNKELLIYRILLKKFNIYKFVFAELDGVGGKNKRIVGCSILYFHNDCIALYCLGTLKEYRHKNIATNIINFSIEYGRRKGCGVFGLQTLESDNLLSFYQKKGFVKSYNNKIYRIFNR